MSNHCQSASWRIDGDMTIITAQESYSLAWLTRRASEVLEQILHQICGDSAALTLA